MRKAFRAATYLIGSKNSRSMGSPHLAPKRVTSKLSSTRVESNSEFPCYFFFDTLYFKDDPSHHF